MHLMLDVETLDTKPTAVVLSLGAVLFTETEVIAKRYFKFNVQTQLDAGRTVSADTIAWWLNQSEKAREVLTPSIQDLTITTFNDQFTQWLFENGACTEDTMPWGNGASFDIPIVEDITREFGMCWDHWNIRCFREFNRLTKCKHLVVRQGTHHNALDDAMYQAECLLAHWEQERDKSTQLEDVLEYYANKSNYDSGDVPGHIYILDDAGREARNILSKFKRNK